jgi:hypothetical protein
MTSLPPLRAHRSIVVALELLGLDDLDAPEQRVRLAVDFVQELLGETTQTGRSDPSLASRLLVSGHRVLRVVPLRPHDSVLFRELTELLLLQLLLFSHGVFVRGALTLGEVAMRSDVLTGSGVTRAVRLRDTVAESTRIVMDPVLLRAVEQEPNLRASHHSVTQELGYLRGLLRLDADGVWFLDYLREANSGFGDEATAIAVLEEHAAVLRRELAGCTSLDASSRPWMWLLGYHNRAVQEHAERAGSEPSPDLLVASDGPLFFTFPGSTKTPVGSAGT